MSVIIIDQNYCITTVNIISQLWPPQYDVSTHQKVKSLILSNISKKKLFKCHNFKKATYFPIKDLNEKTRFCNLIIVLYGILLISLHVKVWVQLYSFLFFLETEQLYEPKHKIRKFLYSFSIHCVLIVFRIKNCSDHQEKLRFYHNCCTVF